jgi:hypothetical protein
VTCGYQQVRSDFPVLAATFVRRRLPGITFQDQYSLIRAGAVGCAVVFCCCFGFVAGRLGLCARAGAGGVAAQARTNDLEI